MLYDITYVECKDYNKLVNITKKKQTHGCTEQISGYQWGEGRGEGQYRGREKKKGLLQDYMKSRM